MTYKVGGTTDEGMRARLALALILLIAAAMAVLMFFEVPTPNRDMLNVVVGALVAKLSDVYGYSFGSSAGRDRQAETMHAVATVAANASASGSTDTLVVAPGQTATATATEGGTIIEKGAAE